MLKLELETECVTYSSDSCYPEISGYGDKVNVKIEGEEYCTISIGVYKFLPHQIEWFLKEIESYRKSVETYHREAK